MPLRTYIGFPIWDIRISGGTVFKANPILQIINRLSRLAYLICLSVFLQFPALRAALLSISGRAPAYLSPAHTRPQERKGTRGRGGSEAGGGERKKNDRDDGLPDKGRGTDCYEILSNARVSAQGASCSRSASRSKTRCSRIRVFVDRANATAGAYIFKTTFTVAIRPIRSLRTKIYTRKCEGIYRMSRTTVISLHHCTKSRAKTRNAHARLDAEAVFEFLTRFDGSRNPDPRENAASIYSRLALLEERKRHIFLIPRFLC